MLDIAAIKKEYNELLKELTSPELISNWEKFEELSKKKKELEQIIKKIEELDVIEKQLKENRAIVSSNDDPELTSLAEKETDLLFKRKKDLEKELEEESNPEKKTEIGSVIVEIRAGTGGDEASMFVADLFKMYSKCAELKGWKQKTLDSNPSDLGGFKEIIFELKGEDVFSKMKNEGGVHRVQRIPMTEKSGRIHTSTASVAVLPKPQKAEMKINPRDLKMDVYKSSGPGGQYVNKRETAVRITHLPTGIIVASQTERNLLQNKENALAILEAKILEMKEKKEMEKLGSERKKQIGTAERAEKIRTYNFPQDRITDHRIKKSFHNIEKIMAGNLDSLFTALQDL